MPVRKLNQVIIVIKIFCNWVLKYQEFLHKDKNCDERNALCDYGEDNTAVNLQNYYFYAHYCYNFNIEVPYFLTLTQDQL